MRASRGRLVVSSLLGFIAFVLGHDLVFVATFGPRYLDGLHETGHGASWTAVVLGAFLATSAIGLATVWRLRRLAGLARELEGGRLVVTDVSVSDLGRRVFVRMSLIAPLAMALFVLAENVEHLLAGEAAPGVAVFGSSEYTALSPLIMAGAAFLVALVAALVDWRHDDLVARIAAAGWRPRHPRGEHTPRPVRWSPPRPVSIIGARLAGRAPPVTIPLS
jgi:hypothetical protein